MLIGGAIVKNIKKSNSKKINKNENGITKKNKNSQKIKKR